MDVGNKTLSQLSDEAKEKRYVTLEVGAKVSGYTKDYLERLCRLNKVEYRLWNGGQFVVEIDSLLRETHTILLSYEDITFIERAEIVDSMAQNVAEVLLSSPSKSPLSQTASDANLEASRMFSKKNTEGITQSIPSFGGVNRIVKSVDNDAFSFVGRAVVSDPLHPPPVEERNTHVPILVNSEAAIGTKESVTPPPQLNIVSHLPIHVAINKEGETIATNISIPPTEEKKSVHLAVQRDAPVKAEEVPPHHDEWDVSILSGGSMSVKKEEKTVPALVVSSGFHPIQTAVDARAHHDPAPLFPLIQKITPPKTPANTTFAPVRLSEIPDLGPEKRVIVFSSRDIPKSEGKASAIIARSGISASALVADGALRQSGPPISSAGPLYNEIPERVLASAPSRQVERVVSAVPEKREAMLPTVHSEQHIALRGQFPLAKSAGFNVAFAACLLLALASLRFDFPDNVWGEPSTYVAAVADADQGKNFSAQNVDVASDEARPSIETLPFSDEIHIATGTNPNTILISPVFGDKKVDPIEYIILRTGSGE